MEIVDRAEQARKRSEEAVRAAQAACEQVAVVIQQLISRRETVGQPVNYDLIAEFTFRELHLQGEAIKLARRALSLAYPDYTVGDLSVWYSDQEGGHTQTEGIQIRFGRISLWERFWRFIADI